MRLNPGSDLTHIRRLHESLLVIGRVIKAQALQRVTDIIIGWALVFGRLSFLLWLVFIRGLFFGLLVLDLCLQHGLKFVGVILDRLDDCLFGSRIGKFDLLFPNRFIEFLKQSAWFSFNFFGLLLGLDFFYGKLNFIVGHLLLGASLSQKVVVLVVQIVHTHHDFL